MPRPQKNLLLVRQLLMGCEWIGSQLMPMGGYLLDESFDCFCVRLISNNKCSIWIIFAQQTKLSNSDNIFRSITTNCLCFWIFYGISVHFCPVIFKIDLVESRCGCFKPIASEFKEEQVWFEFYQSCDLSKFIVHSPEHTQLFSIGYFVRIWIFDTQTPGLQTPKSWIRTQRG